jgi:hypothetical protein
LGFDYLLRLLGLPHPPFLSCTNKDWETNWPPHESLTFSFVQSSDFRGRRRGGRLCGSAGMMPHPSGFADRMQFLGLWPAQPPEAVYTKPPGTPFSPDEKMAVVRGRKQNSSPGFLLTLRPLQQLLLPVARLK